MPNGRLFQFQYSYERDMVEIHLKANVGASGALTLTQFKGILSVVRNSAGNYTINLKDIHNMFFNASAVFNSGASAPAAPLLNVVSSAVSTAQTIVVQFRNLSGVATDPASGEIMHLLIRVRDAST